MSYDLGDDDDLKKYRTWNLERRSLGSRRIYAEFWALGLILLSAALFVALWEVTMRFLRVPVLLLALGLASLAPGCSGVPVKVADGIALANSNTKALGAYWRREIHGPLLSEAEANHVLKLQAAQEGLMSELDTWERQNREDR